VRFATLQTTHLADWIPDEYTLDFAEWHIPGDRIAVAIEIHF
jgi:hypothetical protein